MKRREITLLSVGLIIGLLAGMILVGSSDDLRESLFGTAGGGKDKTDKTDMTYYLVELSAANEWLAGIFPETSENLGEAVDIIARLSTSPDFGEDFKNATEQVDTILPQMYAALVEAEDVESLDVEEDDALAVCLGVDRDYYNPDGPMMYLYLSVSSDQVKDFALSEDWEALDGPKENDMFWEMLACFPEMEENK